MAQIKDLLSQQSSRFSDDYDVYVDYGKGRPVKMNNNEATFIDIEKFLAGLNEPSKKATHTRTVTENKAPVQYNDVNKQQS